MSKVDQAIALAAEGFYVFPIVAGGKAPPRMEGWQRYATRNAPQIQSMWASHPEDNIGIYTGRFAEREALLVVDVDNKEGKNGDSEILRLELEGFDLPTTRTQHTPSGGRHLVYRVSEPVKQGANVLGRGLDIRSRGGYIVAAGSVLQAGHYRCDATPIAFAPDWLVERCGQPPMGEVRQGARIAGPSRVNAGRASARALEYLKQAPVAVQGAGGDETTYKVAATLKDLGVTRDDACDLMAEHWNPRCEPPWSPDELRVKVTNAYRYGNQPQGVAAPEVEFDLPVPQSASSTDGSNVSKNPQNIDTSQKLHPFDELNRDYAFVIAGGGSHILWETTDPEGRYKLEHLATNAFHAKWAARKLQIGKRTVALTDEWMEWEGRRSYDGMVFRPQQTAPARFYNLWRGFAYEPAERYESHPAVEAFLEHAEANICRGDGGLFRWLIGYFAHLVQRPWEKPLVALVFRGGKGVGKNALVERVGALLGGHFLVTSNRRYLIGNFNGHLENCLLFTLDEAFWSGDKQAEGIIKDLITGKNHVIEHKGKEPYGVENKTRIAIIGNEDWLVPASHDERRFAVFDVGDGRKQDRSFFAAMREGMEDAGGLGYSQLLRYLLDYDISKLDFNAAPRTAGLLEQKHASLEPVPAWWLDCLENGHITGADFEGWPPEIECERLRAAFQRHAKSRRADRWLPDERSFGRSLHKFVQPLHKRRLSKSGDGPQPYSYVLPTLAEARQSWERHIGHAVEWPED